MIVNLEFQVGYLAGICHGICERLNSVESAVYGIERATTPLRTMSSRASKI